MSITFDDGYAENCDQAIPLLIEERIPCTYFVTLQNMRYGQPFPHDVALGHRFAPNNLEQLHAMAAAGIEIGGHTYGHANLGPTHDRKRLELRSRRGGPGFCGRDRPPRTILRLPLRSSGRPESLAFELARAAGYEAICSAYGGYNWPGGDAFHLRRVHGDDRAFV